MSEYRSTPPIVLEFGQDEEMIKKMKDAWMENKLVKPDKESYNVSDGEYIHDFGPNTELLRQEAIKLLDQHSFKINQDEYFTEFQYSTVTRHNHLESLYGWHIDDRAVMGGTIVTVKFFVEKDPLLFGGNLFWNPNGKEEDPGKALINTKTGTVIIMPGDTPYTPECISHNQHRFIGRRPPQDLKVIEFQFLDLRRQIIQDEGMDDN